MDESVEVHVTFACGHTESYVSPGCSDPAGVYLDYPRNTDGTVAATSLFTCHTCRKTQ
jgi:hypothetical protein